MSNIPPVDPTLDNGPSLRPQRMPIADGLKQSKPSPNDVIVLTFGSYGIRYGFAADTTPRKLFPAVAFRRRAPHSATDRTTPSPALCVPNLSQRPVHEVVEAKKTFQDIREIIAQELALYDRRRGGGRPIPWKIAVESIALDAQGASERGGAAVKGDGAARGAATEEVLVGRAVELLARDEVRRNDYDIIFPIWDGKVLFDCGAPASLVRKSLEVLLDYIVRQLKQERERKAMQQNSEATLNGREETKPEKEEGKSGLFANDGKARTYVAIVVPETAQRRDVAEIVDAVFRTSSLQTAAVFAHQSAVSCALGAGLATCTVVDIGHSATTVACIDDGMIMGETRVHLNYGSYHIHSAFSMLLDDPPRLKEVLSTEPGTNGKRLSSQQAREDEDAAIARIAEQTGGFNVDENDTLTIAMAKLPSGRQIRVKLGVGIRSLPCYGLVHPKLLTAASTVKTMKKNIPERGLYERNAEDDNFVSDIFNDLRRSGIASAALPIGVFANDLGQPAEKTLKKDEASVVDAVIWSVGKAVEIKKPEQSKAVENYRRFVNAIVLAGGGASIDGIALALEARIKKGFLEIGLNVADVTIIDGGKGKGDEELAAAAALLKDEASNGGLGDDTDTASLPWRGGAVMVEAEAVNDYWIYRDDWEMRNVRALRERAPFYW